MSEEKRSQRGAPAGDPRQHRAHARTQAHPQHPAAAGRQSQHQSQPQPRPAQGASQIWTPANLVTMARIALVLVWLLFAERLGAPAGTLNVATLAVAALYILIASTDKLDGYLARSRGEVTTLGKFLDPIADKLVVVFTLLVLYSWGLVSVWVLVVILTREFLVSGLRMQVAAEGVVVAASNLGKLKTATTMVAIAAYLIYAGLPAGAFATALGFIAAVLMMAAVFFTLWSGVDYFFKCSHLLT